MWDYSFIKICKRVLQNAYTYPFKPPRCIKASFYIPENTLNFPTAEGFRTKISMKLVYQ